MKFTAALLALIPLVTAIPPVFERSADVVDASNSTQALEARIQGNVFVCVDAGFTGNCGVFHGASGQCISFGPDFNDDISAVGPDSDQDCFFFIDGDCLGAQLGPIRNPGIPNLNVPPNVQFNDQISSFKCFFG